MPHAVRYAYLAVAVALAAAMVVVAVRARRRGALRSGSVVVLIVSALPLVYVGLTHAGIARETYLRFHHPEALVACSLAGAFLAWRFSQLPLRMSKLRRGLVIALSTAATLAALFAVAEPEIGKPLDRMTIILAVDRSRSIDLVPGADGRIRNELRVAEIGMHAAGLRVQPL